MDVYDCFYSDHEIVTPKNEIAVKGAILLRGGDLHDSFVGSLIYLE
jgi:hypothetical protein